MLERATACFKPGAFRDSLKCARDQPRKSRRLLHSTFWNHGVGDLDVPFFLIPNRATAKRAPTSNDSDTSAPSGQGLFLDFLYPPQALTWLRRKQGQQLQRWEARNMSRLPKGYVVASKRHASNSYRPFDSIDEKVRLSDPEEQGARVEEAEQRSTTQQPDFLVSSIEPRRSSATSQWVDVNSTPSSQSGPQQREWAEIENIPIDEETEGLPRVRKPSEIEEDLDEVHQQFSCEFGDSPGELAENAGSRVQLLRNLLTTMQLNRDPGQWESNQSTATRAWKIYNSLDDEAKDDDRLRQELIQWMAAQDGDDAAVQCQELFAALSTSRRTMEVYSAITSQSTRRKDCKQVLKLHQEALENLENGYLITRQIFENASKSNYWQLVFDVVMQHNKIYTGKNQVNQVRLFWLYVSDLPQLFAKAIGLARHVSLVGGLRKADQHVREFCLRFFKEAVVQEFIQLDPRTTSFPGAFGYAPRGSIRPMFRHIIDMDPNAAQFLEHVMLTAMRPKTRLSYQKYHHVFGYVYQHYCRIPGVQPSEELLSTFLSRLTEYWAGRSDEHHSTRSLDIEKILTDWKRYHGHVNIQAVHSLLSHYASRGDLRKFNEIMEYQDNVYSAYESQKDALWTRIHVHAQRSELDLAQQAFAEVARLTREHNDHPDLRCWNMLLLAHARVDDLEGALTNFQNIIDHAKLQPDVDSFEPLLTIVANRGDVAAVEDLLDQYDQLVDEPRSAKMMLSLMTAHFRVDDNAFAAETVLQKAIHMEKQGEVVGSLTPCFNALMSFYARRRDLDAASRVYRLMRQEKTELDGDTFVALIQTLVLHRQLWSADIILRRVMPKHRVPATAYHYALLMAGYNRQNIWHRVLWLQKHMTGRKIKPSVGTNANYLKAKAHSERVALGGESSELTEGEPRALEETLDELKRLISQQDHIDRSSGQDSLDLNFLVDRGDPITPYFDFLIYIHGERQCFAAVKELMKEYTQLATVNHRDDKPSMLMLTALMSASYHAGDHEKVEEYWKLAVEQARDVARTIKIPRFVQKGKKGKIPDPLELQPSEEHAVVDADSEARQKTGLKDVIPADGAVLTDSDEGPKQVLLTDKIGFKPKPYPGKSDILDNPLQWYLKALMSQARIAEAIKLVSQLISQGYFISRTTWNLFIRQLLDTRPPLALLAFVLTERFMMPHFPGWQPGYYPPRPADYAYHLELIRARYIGRTVLMPERRTLEGLGRAMLDLRRLELRGERELYKQLPKELRRFVGTIKDLRLKARATVQAVQTIPRLPEQE